MKVSKAIWNISDKSPALSPPTSRSLPRWAHRNILAVASNQRGRPCRAMRIYDFSYLEAILESKNQKRKTHNTNKTITMNQ